MNADPDLQILLDSGIEAPLANLLITLAQKLNASDFKVFFKEFTAETCETDPSPREFSNSREDLFALEIARELWKGSLESASAAVDVYFENFPQGSYAKIFTKLLSRKRNRSLLRPLTELSQSPTTQIKFHPIESLSGDSGHIEASSYPLGIFELPDAQIIGSRAVMATREGFILKEQNSGGNPVDDISFQHPQNKTSSDLRKIPNAVNLVSTCTYCFYHWMMDSLPKAVIAEMAGFNGNYIVPGKLPFVEQSLALLGVSSERLIPLEQNRVNVESLWIPTFWRGDRFHVAPKLFWKFRNKLLTAVSHIPTTSPRKIYIGRRDTEKARIVKNDQEVSEILRKAGFEKVYMEDLSLVEQIALIRDADFLVGPHGSGMLHSIFMSPGSRLIEFMEPHYINHLFSIFSAFLKHRHYSIVSAVDGQYNLGRYIEVPIVPLQQILEQELSRTEQ